MNYIAIIVGSIIGLSQIISIAMLIWCDLFIPKGKAAIPIFIAFCIPFFIPILWIVLKIHERRTLIKKSYFPSEDYVHCAWYFLLAPGI